jgi:hypothetical protein
MKARMAASISKTTTNASPIWCAPKKIGVHRKFSAICDHHSFIGQPLRSRCQTRQPAMAIRI